MQAMRDALYLSKAIELVGKSATDKSKMIRFMREYQNEMLSRGSKSVRLSRDEWTKVSKGGRSSWGTKRSIIPFEKVTLNDIPFKLAR